jgi:hypothetical protein
MEFSTGIGEPVNKFNSEERRKGNYFFHKQTPEKSPNKLRIGEIVKGTILDTHFANIATVKLPIGTLKAELNGSLEKGDTLFFIVQEVEPSLILKIYSLQVIQDKKVLDTAEIIRILDVPNNKFFNKLIDHIKLRRTIIVRDEISACFENFSLIKNVDYQKLPASTLFDTLLFFSELGIQFSLFAFNQMKFAFYSTNNIEKLINSLYDYISLSLNDIIKPIYKDLEHIDSSFKFQDFFTFRNDSFGQKVINIISKEHDKLDETILEMLKTISKVISAKEAEKVLQISSGNIFTIFVPYRITDIIQVLEINCDILSNPAKYWFDIEIQHSKVSITIEFTKADTKLTLISSNKSKEIRDFAEKVKSAFIDNAKQIILELKDAKELNKYVDLESSSKKNITYVI